MTEQLIEETPPEKRLARYLGERLDPSNKKYSVAKLAKTLGYSNPTMVKMWIEGKAKVPLKQITPVAHYLNVDISDLLPLYFQQECPDDYHLYNAGLRTLSVWEFMLVSVARDVYGADEE